MQKITRDSRIEMMRIMSIYIIVLHHLVLHSAIENYVGISFNRAISQLYLIGGKIGVNLFVFISGYFGLNNKFKSQRIVKIEEQMLFYTLLFFIAQIFFATDTVTLSTLLKAIFPTTFKSYWYVTTYVGMLLLSPFVNMTLRRITSRQYAFLLSVCLFLFSISPTFLRQRNWTSDLSWFITLYIIGAAIKRFEYYLLRISQKKWLIGGGIVSLLTWGLSLVLMILSNKWESLNSYVNVFSTSNYSTFLLVIAVCIFMSFMTAKSFQCSAINRIAGFAFGVYLIQSNPFVSSVLWSYIEGFELYNSKFWFLLAPIIALMICVVCVCIEAGRIILMKNVHFLNKTCDRINGLINLN